jgi:DNA-binding NarL/FixJ family response regulator
MVSVLIADTQEDERSALQLLLKDMDMNVLGEAGDWNSLLSQVVVSEPDLVLIDYGLIQPDSESNLEKLRKLCPAETMVVLISNFGAHEQAALSAGVDLFISKNERFDTLAQRLRAAAESINLKRLHGDHH